MRGSCAVSMLSMRAHSRPSGFAASLGFCAITRSRLLSFRFAEEEILMMESTETALDLHEFTDSRLAPPPALSLTQHKQNLLRLNSSAYGPYEDCAAVARDWTEPRARELGSIWLSTASG